MQKRSVYISAGLHVGLMIMATISWPWLKRDFVVPQPMMVEMVDIAELTQTDKPRPTPVPKQEEEPPKEEEVAPPPKPKVAENKEQAPAPPAKKEEKKADDKKDKEKKEEPKPDKKKEPEKKKEEKKKEAEKENTKDFSSVLKNLTESDEKTPPVPTPAPNLDSDAKPTQGANAPVGDKMTMREEDALRAQLEKCWNVPYGAKDAGDIVVEIFMVINPDRTLREARVVDTLRYNNDTFYRAMADSAMRAVRNPLCSPFELPADKYNVWKSTTVTFNPSQMY